MHSQVPTLHNYELPDASETKVLPVGIIPGQQELLKAATKVENDPYEAILLSKIRHLLFFPDGEG